MSSFLPGQWKQAAAHGSKMLIKAAGEASVTVGETLESRRPSFRAGSMWWLVFQADTLCCHRSRVEGALRLSALKDLIVLPLYFKHE